MGMSNWILDVEEKFWDHAHKIVGDCESHKEFKELMFKFDKEMCLCQQQGMHNNQNIILLLKWK
jgi:hypothetical protein